jgi:quinol monooxygenase YgiN
VHARSTTVSGDPQRIDEGIAYVRDEVHPITLGQEGFIGLSMLVDRESGRTIVTSAWSSEEAMQASGPRMQNVRARGAEIMGGEVQVEEWEVAVMHRAHDAGEESCCRVSWLRLAAHGDVKRAIDIFRTGMLPGIEAFDGFCSTSLLVDRVTGHACITVAFDSREAMEASRDQAWALRDSGAREAGVDVTDVAEFELALAQLRLPELV